MNATELQNQTTHELLLTRCDRCPATITAVAILTSGNAIQLCRAHLQKHATALHRQGARLAYDYSHMLARA